MFHRGFFYRTYLLPDKELVYKEDGVLTDLRSIAGQF